MECGICLETYNENKLIKGGCCSFKLCKKCFDKLPSSICPVCKLQFPFKASTELKNELKVPDHIDLPAWYLPKKSISANNTMNLGIPIHHYPLSK